jgi:acyl carrier protein
MRLVGHLEERYRLSITDDDLVPENFETIVRLAEFVAQKRGERP